MLPSGETCRALRDGESGDLTTVETPSPAGLIVRPLEAGFFERSKVSDPAAVGRVLVVEPVTVTRVTLSPLFERSRMRKSEKPLFWPFWKRTLERWKVVVWKRPEPIAYWMPPSANAFV